MVRHCVININIYVYICIRSGSLRRCTITFMHKQAYPMYAKKHMHTRTQTELDLIIDKHQSGKPGGLRGKWSDGAEENDRKTSKG